MVGVQLTSQEAQRVLDAIAGGKLGPVDDPKLVALERACSSVAHWGRAPISAVASRTKGRPAGALSGARTRSRRI